MSDIKPDKQPEPLVENQTPEQPPALQAQQADQTTPGVQSAQSAKSEAAEAERKAGARPIEERPWRNLFDLVSARLRAVSDRTARGITRRTLKIGVSARIFHPQAGSRGLSSKTLQYLEESIAQWVMSRDVMVFMIPSVNTNGLIRPSNIRLRDYAKHLDGLARGCRCGT